MKELRRNMRLIGAVILCLFVGAACWYGVTVYTQGAKWASNVYNIRLQSTSANRGDITDRKGEVLATTNKEGKREYLADARARMALSQTVGDTAGMSGVGVESYFSSTLLNLSSSITDRFSEVFGNARHVGSSIRLTIDAGLQTYIASQFPAGYSGAVCVVNYKTGEILSMVSLPNYDPYNAASGQNVVDTAYLNRCLQGLYTPGSIFKIVTAAAALDYDAGVASQRFVCGGTWDYGVGSVNCMSGTAVHGELTLEEAFMRSCNVTFGKLAYQLGEARLRQTAESFGFNDVFKFDDITLYDSSFPTSMRNMNALVWAGIGQGEVLITPLHAAMISAAVANGGIMMTPALVRSVTTSLGVTTKSFKAVPYRRVMSENAANTIAGYMYRTVRSGTGTKAAIANYTVCGKTGSAETSDDKNKATNAWYTGFVYDDNHPYAIAVVIEEGGSGGNLSASLAAKALKYAIEHV